MLSHLNFWLCHCLYLYCAHTFASRLLKSLILDLYKQEVLGIWLLEVIGPHSKRWSQELREYADQNGAPTQQQSFILEQSGEFYTFTQPSFLISLPPSCSCCLTQRPTNNNNKQRVLLG